MGDPDRRPGLEGEPQYRSGLHERDPSEERAERTLRHATEQRDRGGEVADHSVFDEPGHRSADPLAKPGYAQWLVSKREAWSAGRGWLVAFLTMLGGGPWAVIGAFVSMQVDPIVTGPVAEEILKVAILATLLEIRPWAFTSRLQIHAAAAGSALGFAAIENLIYIHVYVANPSPDFILWRWTVCVALHVGCSLIASIGVARVWRESHGQLTRPRLTAMLPMLVAAIVVHGAYNAFATLLPAFGVTF